jgi:hypothetical protein
MHLFKTKSSYANLCLSQTRENIPLMMVVLWRPGGGGHLHGRPLPLADEDARPVSTGYVLYCTYWGVRPLLSFLKILHEGTAILTPFYEINFTDLSMVAIFFLPFWAHLASKFAKTTNSVYNYKIQ